MRDKIPPIVDEHGRDYRVRARQTIGAEHLEAALQWTDRYYEAATREHVVYIGADGLHRRTYHAQAVLRIQPPYWRDGSTLQEEGRLLPDSVFWGPDPGTNEAREWTAAEWEEHHGNPRYTVTALSAGTFRVTDVLGGSGVWFASGFSAVFVANMPRVILNGSREPSPMFAVVSYPPQGFGDMFDVKFWIDGGLHPGWYNNGLGSPLTFICYSIPPGG